MIVHNVYQLCLYIYLTLYISQVNIHTMYHHWHSLYTHCLHVCGLHVHCFADAAPFTHLHHWMQQPQCCMSKKKKLSWLKQDCTTSTQANLKSELMLGMLHTWRRAVWSFNSFRTWRKIDRTMIFHYAHERIIKHGDHHHICASQYCDHPHIFACQTSEVRIRPSQ